MREYWPAFIEELGIDRALLPPVVPAGTTVGSVHSSVGEAIGLPPGVQVVAGMTDANTAQVASGAFGLGQWVTTIGTGLSLKGVSKTIIKDPHGALYCHRHPDGYWIPSGTSHSGADAIVARFPNEDLDRLTEAAQARKPAQALVFPLPRKGEFFPFWAPEATGFEVGFVDDEVTLFRSCLEGIAYIERLSLDVATSLGADVVGPVTTMGGGSRSALWRQIRADVLGRPVRAVANPETALGAALVALAPLYGSITAIASAAASYVGEVEPRPHEEAVYGAMYLRFLEQLVERGYLESDMLAHATRESGS